MPAVSVFLPDEAATIELAARVADLLPRERQGWLLLLQGELGAGKSTFARGLLRALGHRGTVPSPTYTLVEPYELAWGTVYHVDLYRVADPEELRFLGFDELEQGLRLVEWPERAPELTQTADLGIRLEYDGDGRRASCAGLSPRGERLVAALGSLAKS